MSAAVAPRTWPATVGILLALSAASAAAVLLWGMATRADALRFRTLLVSGALSQVTPDEVRGVVQPWLTAGFLGIDLAGVQHALEALPWVAEASVRREWPGTLRVTLVEEVPVARWSGGGLLNADGEVFAREAVPAGLRLPELGGPDGSQRELLEMHAAMTAVLAPLGLAPTRLDLSARRAWELTAGEDIVVRLGRHAVLDRIGRFARVAAPVVVPQRALVAYVDMRYTNGFAVGWRVASARDGSRRSDVQEA